VKRRRPPYPTRRRGEIVGRIAVRAAAPAAQARGAPRPTEIQERCRLLAVIDPDR
jgi:hypothetical protein